jgi:hypothetical protein
MEGMVVFMGCAISQQQSSLMQREVLSNPARLMGSRLMQLSFGG